MAERILRTTAAALASPARGMTGWRRWTALVLQLAGAGLLAWIGWVHWYIWHLGYRNIPTDGPFFLIDAVVGVALAIALLASPRPLIGLIAAGFVASTIVALLISLNFGLFGFHESTTASFVGESLWLESVAVVVLVAWAVITARAGRAAPAAPGRHVALSSLSVTTLCRRAGYPSFAPATTRARRIGVQHQGGPE